MLKVEPTNGISNWETLSSFLISEFKTETIVQLKFNNKINLNKEKLINFGILLPNEDHCKAREY